MTRKTGWRKFGSKGVVLLLSLLLLIGLAGGAFAQTEQPLENYATSIKAELKANAQGEDLPQYVENGQSLFFELQISNFKSQELVTYLKNNPEADFTIPLDFTGHIEGNYPNKINPDDFDNVAYVKGKPLFRWWIDEGSDVVRVRFDENWINNAGSNTVVETVKLGFDGTLNVKNKGADGKIVFNAANTSFPLQMKTGYVLNKAAGVPYYSTDLGAYLTDYTVTLTLDQNMMLSGNADMYIAALTLVDTVENGGALQGIIAGDVAVTAPDGETAAVTVSNNGTVNTLTLTSPDQKLTKGIYTFTYKMKIEPDAAAAKLEGYTEKQKTNTVELKENASSLKTPLTADATIAWEEVTDNQFKIDKSAFTEKAPDYKGVYWDEDTDKYYIDFRVVVYVREPVSTFTVTDHSNYSLTFRNVPTPPVLEGADVSENYWNNDINNAALTDVAATVASGLNDSSEMVITVTAPEGQMLAPGAYHLRVPADVTGAVETTLKNSYPQSYSNTAYLTSVDGQPTTESKEFKQAIPNRAEPRKDGGYAVNSTTGELIFHNGKPVIRWDVWFGWDFYDKTTFKDTLSGMEMLISSDYPFDIHSFTDQNHRKECLASITSLSDTDYLDFNANGTEFTFTNDKLYTNADGTPVKLYKLVYFTTPLDADNELGYVNAGLENGYSITHTTQSGDGFGTGPITGVVEPNMTSQGRLYVKKKHVIERTDSLTQWLITCDNTTNKIPFARFNDLDIIDLVPQGQTPIGEVTIHYSDAWPIEVEMVCSNNQRVTLTEGTHYSIVKKLEGYDFGDNGEYGFAVDLDMDAVAAVLAAQNCAYFKTIEVKCYLNNETHSPGQNYRVKNDGWLDYTNQGVELVEGVNAYYDRGFATKSKGVVEYGDNYDPNAPRRYYVCNPDGSSSQQSFTGGYDDDPTTGDGQDEIVWRIYLGAREFGNDDEPIKVTVTDTFSDNQMFPTYEGKSVKDLFIIRAEKNQDYVILPDSVSVNGNSFTLTFTVPAGGWVENNKDISKNLYIYYHTILKPEAIQDALDAASKDASTIKIDYTNTATVGWNGESYTLPTKSGSMTMNGSMLDKTAKFMQSSGSKVSYTIEMNPYRLDLASGSDVILLEDSMGNGKDVFSYIPSSFKLINLDTGAQLSPSSAASATTYVLKMAEDGKSFTLDVPDNTHLKLTYQVKTTQPVGTKDVSLLNSASLAGRKPQAETITFDVSSAYQSGSFSVLPDEAGIRLVKISSEGADSDSPTFLSGAAFAVTRLDSSFQQVGTEQTMTTDAKGLIEIKEKLTDGLYVVVEETKAPEGYRLGSAPWKWCYALVPANKSLSDADVAKLKETVHCDVTVISAGSYVEDSITNDPMTLKVRKVDAAGNLLDGAKFTLKKGDAAINPDSTYNVTGELLFKSLKGGNYTLEETAAPEGYAVPEECPWKFTLDENGGVMLAGDYRYISLSEDGLYLVVLNEYKADGSVQFEGAKSLTGTDLQADQFSFILNGDGVNETVKNDANGKFKFSKIEYTLADVGEHTYTVTEVNDGKTGYTYDDTEYEIVVNVADAGDGTLNVTYTVNGTESGEISFKNEYAADGSVQFEGSKSLTGATLQDGQFSFTLTGDGVTETVKNDADGQFGFTEIDYTLDDVGEHTYTVTEVNDGKAGYTYDDTEYEIVVNVADAGDGTLNVTYTVNGTENGNIAFANKYKADGSVQFGGIKTLTGTDLQADQFSFTLTGDDVNETVKNDANGKFKFSKIEYTLADVGEHTYTVTEVNDGKAGYTYDDTEYKIIVTVADAGDGTLNVTYTVNGTESGNIAFANKYKADGSVQFMGTKTLTGTDLQADQFSFILTGDGVTETVQNDETGKFVFTEIKYTLDNVGEHTYTVTEVNDGKTGYTYDATEYKIIVTVSDAGDGTLNVTYTVNGTESGDIAFKNEYAADGSVQFGGTKTLTGTDLQADQFSFTLTGDGVNETVKNDANGKFKFSEIEYTLADVGEHTYTVTEVNDGKAGYTYDDTEYEIVVNVADAGDGTLHVTYTVNGKADTKIVFANTYNAAGSFQIYGEKQVDGKEPEESEIFAFTLKDADGNALQTVKNEKGLITFAPMAYTLADSGKTFVYTVEETTESDAAYETDDRVYTLSVTVTDDGKGGMTPAWTLTCDGEEAERMVFNNKRLGSLTIEKTVVGGDAEKAFAFKVTLADADGKELNGTYPVTGADVSSIASGEYLHLKNGEKAEITYLPMGTKYMVEEDEYKAYETTANGEAGRIAQGIIGEEAAMVSYVNTEKTVSFSVTKEWQGGDGGSIQLTLYGNGEKLNPQPSYERNGNVYTYQNLPQYTKDGQGIVYAAKEKFMDGYMTIYMNKAPFTQETDMIYDGGTIVNRAVTDFRVKKVWEGLAEGEEMPEITLVLYCNGEVMDKKTPKPDENGWYIYHNLPITKNGEAAKYSVVEEALDGFTVTYGDDAEATCAYDGDTIVNRKIPKTGDDSRIGLWLAITAVSAAGCILLLKKRKEA